MGDSRFHWALQTGISIQPVFWRGTVRPAKGTERGDGPRFSRFRSYREIGTLGEGALIIQGERKQEHKEDHEGFHRWERSYGQFYRSIPLPEGAKTDQAKAELTDGVLKVSVPVAETKKKTTRQVPIEQGKDTKPAESKPAAA